ncbi:MAG: DUF5665 domain-containing protein [Candidatus Saccharimonadales bacterium]
MVSKNSGTQKKSVVETVKRDTQMGARRAVIEELFNDFYDDRRNIYVMNFFRGVFFGFGSVIGGTAVVALVIWILSFFVQLPGVGQTAEQAQDRLRTEQRK